MKLGSAGEAFFVHQTSVNFDFLQYFYQEELLDREDLRTSPIMSPGENSPRGGNLSPDEAEIQKI